MEEISHEEKERRKKAFLVLTEQQRAEYEREYIELCRWNELEREKIREKLKQEGKWKDYGLDANQEHYRGIIAEYRKRFRALQIKYGIVSETQDLPY